MGWDGAGGFERTNGTQTGPTTWDQADQAGSLITTDEHDAHDQDLAEGLEACLTRNGENSPSHNLPMNNKRHTGVQDAVARTDYASYGQLLDRAGHYLAPAAVGGTADAIELTPDPAVAAYAAGQLFRFLVKIANEGVATVDVNGLGAKDIKKVGTTGIVDLVAGDLKVGNVVWLQYDGVQFIATGTSPAALGDAANKGVGTQAGDLVALEAAPADSGLAGGRLPASVLRQWSGTHAQYEAIAAKADDVLYFTSD